nr:MAG TPA: hypothetical protein [Caudoviricetes sp.]
MSLFRKEARLCLKNRIYVKFYASLSNSRNGGQRQKDFRPRLTR